MFLFTLLLTLAVLCYSVMAMTLQTRSVLSKGKTNEIFKLGLSVCVQEKVSTRFLKIEKSVVGVRVRVR